MKDGDKMGGRLAARPDPGWIPAALDWWRATPLGGYPAQFHKVKY